MAPTTRSQRRTETWNPGCLPPRCGVDAEDLSYDDGEWFEVCPGCAGEAEGCTTCWDEGVVPHFCREVVE